MGGPFLGMVSLKCLWILQGDDQQALPGPTNPKIRGREVGICTRTIYWTTGIVRVVIATAMDALMG